MKILARRNRILWVNSIGMRRPTASRADLSRLALKLRRGLSGCREVEANLHVLSPLVLPIPGWSVARRVNSEILVAAIRRASRRIGIERPILWSFMPNVGGLVGRLGERMVVYHCVDEYSAFTGVPVEALRRMERDLVKRSAIVLTSSSSLRDERRPLNPETYFIPHGVDVAHFSKALSPTTEVPAEMRRLPRPVIGFFGLIADWVDLSIFRALAMAHPEWSIVLIGRSACDTRVLRDMPNVHFMGQKPYAALPACCRGFDVAVLPFQVNRLTLRANPLKLREYLAAGLPVVATPLPEVARYRGLVRLAETPMAFVAHVEEALRETGAEAAHRRLSAMQAEGWEARVEQMSRIITQRRLAMAS
jgi:glycosyltransferase involved in cell wall biosynthesis